MEKGVFLYDEAECLEKKVRKVGRHATMTAVDKVAMLAKLSLRVLRCDTL